MSTQSDKPLNGTPEPFRRPMVWGRPPATVFRAGPLPKGDSLPPLPEPPRAPQPRPAGPGIFSGSMIPRAAPEPVEPTPAQTAPVAPMAAVEEAPVTVAPAPDLTVRPLPPVEPAPARPVPEPALAAAPATPAVAPSPVAVEPTVAGSTLQDASARGKSSGRTLLYGGVAVAAIAVIALAGWLFTRAPANAPAPAEGPVIAAPVETPTPPAVVTAAAPEPAATEAAPVPPPAAKPPAPTTARPAAAAPARTSPPPVSTRPAPPPAITTAPLIEIAPVQPAGPPPTEAERPSADPDAPIATRPQPVG